MNKVVGALERVLQGFIGLVHTDGLLLRERLLPGTAHREPVGMEQPLTIEVATVQRSRFQLELGSQAKSGKMVKLPGRLHGLACRAEQTALPDRPLTRPARIDLTACPARDRFHGWIGQRPRFMLHLSSNPLKSAPA